MVLPLCPFHTWQHPWQLQVEFLEGIRRASQKQLILGRAECHMIVDPYILDDKSIIIKT